MSTLSFFIFLNVVYSIEIPLPLPSSCIDLEDGYHWIKILSDDIYPPIHVLCSNQYMILDVNHDENIKLYFNTFDSFHYALAGANPQISVNWQQWFIPSSIEQTPLFLLSPDCSICDETDNKLQDFGINTAYYMTGTVFGCLSTYKAERDCLWDWNTYECKYCTMVESDADLGYHVFSNDESHIDEYNHWMDQYTKAETENDPNSWWFAQIGLCGVYSRPADTHEIAKTRKQCFAFDNQYNPSIGTDGRYCQCYKPETKTDPITISHTQFMQYKNRIKYEQQQSVDNNNKLMDLTPKHYQHNVYKLYQNDFKHGTYRITQSGKYIIMEDIEFDFNAGDINDPNFETPADGAWWPHIDQIDKYPGAYTTRDEYFMGFFAGITIETSHVILDLNGFEIRMSRPFYYQQRFFACVSLKSVVFNLNQGPGIFGTDPQYASNVVIKNGKIGLSSHHGIHGHGNNNIVINNVHIHGFETHGVQLSAFNDIKLQDVEIGPASKIAYLNGEYGFARFTLQKLERIKNDMNKYNTDIFPFSFSGRNKVIKHIEDIIDPLRDEMDMAFKYVMSNGNTHITDSAKTLFINSDGVPYGAVMYGLFLNLYFANVFQIHPSLKHSKNAIIENVKIHDLIHKTREYLRLDEFSITPYANPYNAALDARSVLGDDIVELGYYDIPWDIVQYKGDVLTDAHIALDLCTNDWGEKGLMVIGKQFAEWALGKYQWSFEDDHLHPFLGCNNDRMTHVAKGVMGIRIDGVENIQFNSLNVYNLHEQSPVGSDLCSEYWDGNMENFFGTGHFLQNSPYLYGYTGNMVHGIFADFTDFTISGGSNIYDLYSNTGLVYGIGAYTSVEVNVKDELNIYKLASGIKLMEKDTKKYKHPYHPAVVKPFHVVDTWVKYGNTFYSNVNILDKENSNLNIRCLLGKDGIQNDLQMDDLIVENIDCDVNLLNMNFVSVESQIMVNNNVYYLIVVMCLSFSVCVVLMSWKWVYYKYYKGYIVNKDGNHVSYGSI